MRLRRPHGLANPQGFDYEVWMLEQGLGATGTVRASGSDQTRGSYANVRLNDFVFSLNNAVELARGRLREHILSALAGADYAPVIVALVIGDQNGISQHDWKVFSATGVSHLIAISGLHISMVAGLGSGIMLYLWRHSFFTRCQLPLRIPAQKMAALVSVLIALLYVALAGFGVPAQRTLIMIAGASALTWFDHKTSAVHALFLALGLVLLLDPWAVLWPGFWLSFSAVGLIFYSSLGRHRDTVSHQQDRPTESRMRRFLTGCQQACQTQYAITVGLVPLTLLLFSQVSVISPVANAVAIPVVSLLVTPMALLGSIVPDPAGGVILMLTHRVLEFLLVFLNGLSQLSWALWLATAPEIWMFLAALLGTFWCLAPRGWPLRWTGLLLWLPLLLNHPANPAQGEFRVTALDVGQGMALLVETAGHRLLYDTGPTYGPQSDAGSRVILPYLKMRGINSLDGLMISHNDTDHSGGALSVLEQVRIAWVSSSLKSESPIVRLAQRSSQHSACLAGQSWVWDGVQFEVLHPTASVYASDKWKPNARSCTLKISNARRSMLLAGDIEAIQEDELVGSVAEKLPATVLLVPHHGSGTSSTVPFLNAVHPQLALFQLGYHNRYHHPKAEIWQRYADLGIARLRSDQSGAVTLHFSDELCVEEFRRTHARYWYAPAVSDYIVGNNKEECQ